MLEKTKTRQNIVVKLFSVLVCALLAASLIPLSSASKAWAADDSVSFIFYDCYGPAIQPGVVPPKGKVDPSNPKAVITEWMDQWGYDVLSKSPIVDVTVEKGSIYVSAQLATEHFCGQSVPYDGSGTVEVDGVEYYSYAYVIFFSGTESWCVKFTCEDGSSMTFGDDGGGVYTPGSGSFEKKEPSYELKAVDFQLGDTSKPLFTFASDGAVNIKVDGEEYVKDAEGNPFEFVRFGGVDYGSYDLKTNWTQGVVGTHTVSVSIAESDKYKALEEQTFEVKVAKAGGTEIKMAPLSTQWNLKAGDEPLNVKLSTSSYSGARDLSKVTPSFEYTKEGVVEISCESLAGNMTVTPLKAGTTVVTMTTPEDEFCQAYEQTFTVTIAESGKVLKTPSLSNDSSYTLVEGGSTAQFAYTGDGVLSVSSSDPEVVEATKGEDGKTVTLTPVAEGKATVKVSASAGEEYTELDEKSIAVEVKPEGTEVPDPVNPSDKEVVKLTASVEAGKSGTIVNEGETLFLYDVENNAVKSGEAVSADEKVATAEYKDGVLTIKGIAVGTTTVTVTSDDAATTGEVEVEVTAATSFSLNDNGTGVSVGLPTGGANIPTSSQIVVDVTKLTSGNAYDTLKNNWVAETLLGVYDIAMTVNGEEVHDGFGTMTVSFPVPGGYEQAYVYHLNDDGTVDKSIALPVSNGKVTLDVDSLSTFAVAAADDTGTGSGNDNGTGTSASAGNGLSKTGDEAMYLIYGAVGAFVAFAGVAGGFANGLRRRCRSAAVAPLSDE